MSSSAEASDLPIRESVANYSCLVEINRPIFLNTPLSAVAEKRYSSPVGIVLFRRRGPASGSDLGGSTPGQDRVLSATLLNSTLLKC
jgi:hypothetical protein